MKKFIVNVMICCLCIDNFAFANTYDLSQISQVKLVIEYSDDTTVDQMDTVTFGSYPQNDESASIKDSIEWIVLDKDEDKILLLSKYILDNKCYNDELSNVTWETCTLRNWLNNKFYNIAFDNDEKNKIDATYVINNDNGVFNIKGGNNTTDKIFCLSVDEVKKYFYQPVIDDQNMSLATKGTKYAKNVYNKGYNLRVASDAGFWSDGNSSYWL